MSKLQTGLRRQGNCSSVWTCRQANKGATAMTAVAPLKISSLKRSHYLSS